jgi:hypothetical protein
MDDKLNPVMDNFFSTIKVCSFSVNKCTRKYTSTFSNSFILTVKKIAKFICAVVKNS